MGAALKYQHEGTKNYRYTYEDYLNWDDKIRRELIDGVPHMMAAPSIRHQEISMELSLQLGNFLKGKPCKVLSAPVDVRLNAAKKDNTVVQPDLIVVCDQSKIEDGKSCKGAPDMIIEITSPSNSQRDYLVKYKKYLEAGVREYWIVNPENQTVQSFVLENEKYFARIYGPKDSAPVHVLEGCEINLPDVLGEPLFPQEDDVNEVQL